MTSQFYSKSLLVAIFAMGSVSGFAQDERLLADADAVLNSEQINIDGTYLRKEREKTPEEILDEARRQSEIRQIKKIAKRIEKMALPERQVKKITRKESKRLASRINTIFSDGEDEAPEVDKVEVKQAAPALAPMAPIITPIIIERVAPKKEIKPFSQIKVIPYYGFQNILGEQIDFSSKVNTGITVESMLNNRFSAGIGFNYSSHDIQDVANDYDAQYYNGRELGYNHLTIELNGKLFLATGSVIRPYVGVGISYNRASLKFTDTTYVDSAADYQEEKYSSSYMAGHARIGTEIQLAKNIGLNFEFSYSHGLLKGFDYTSYNETFGQQKLNKLGGMIEDADFVSVNGGLVVSF